MPEQQPISNNQVALMAWLADNGHIRLRLISLLREGTLIGPVPLIRVTPGFLGLAGGYTLGWGAIGEFLDRVMEVFFHVMDGGVAGEEGGARDGEGGGERDGGGLGDGERGGDGDSDTSSSSGCGCWLPICMCGRG